MIHFTVQTQQSIHKSYTFMKYTPSLSGLISLLAHFCVPTIIHNWACKNRACRRKLHPLTQKVISQKWNRIFVFCYLQHIAIKCLIITENFMVIAYHHKKFMSHDGLKKQSNFLCPHALFLQVRSQIPIYATKEEIFARIVS